MNASLFLPYADVKTNEPMAKHTTFHIGGSADLFVTPKNEDGLKACLRLCREENVTPFFLGNGSNLLVSDEGLRGVVLYLGENLGEISVDGETVTAGAGAKLADVCRAAEKASLAGLAFAYGIPGSVGGGVFMNAGAYNGELKDVVQSVTVLTKTGEEVTYKANDCGFSYRHSRFMEEESVILKATFALQKGDRDRIAAQMKDILSRRKEKQPLEYPSAGSVFRRPEGYFAGALIEGAGLKGVSVGGAFVSEKHAGFIVNKGAATAADVKALIQKIQQTVLEKDGVELVCEIRMV